jgi:C4-type Zn-finger protein
MNTNKNSPVKIERVICPNCQKEMFRQENIIRISRKGMDKMTHWNCPDCVYCYDDEWFNNSNFQQYEKFVLRDGDDIEDWIKNLKQGDCIAVEEIKKSRRRPW